MSPGFRQASSLSRLTTSSVTQLWLGFESVAIPVEALLSMARAAVGGRSRVRRSRCSRVIQTAGEAEQSITKSTSGIGVPAPVRWIRSATKVSTVTSGSIRLRRSESAATLDFPISASSKPCRTKMPEDTRGEPELAEEASDVAPPAFGSRDSQGVLGGEENCEQGLRRSEHGPGRRGQTGDRGQRNRNHGHDDQQQDAPVEPSTPSRLRFLGRLLAASNPMAGLLNRCWLAGREAGGWARATMLMPTWLQPLLRAGIGAARLRCPLPPRRAPAPTAPFGSPAARCATPFHPRDTRAGWPPPPRRLQPLPHCPRRC